MLRALIALAVAVIIVGASVLCALPFQSRVGHIVAFWPGIAVQWLFKPIGISFTDTLVFVSTLLFWWLSVWLVLRHVLPGRPISFDAALRCPYCKSRFELTWSRYWKDVSGLHVCSSCGRKSKLSTGFRYWGLYVPLLAISPFAVICVALLVYGTFVPRHDFEEHVRWFLGSPWFLGCFVVLCAPLFCIDRLFDARFRRLRVPKDAV